MPDMYEIYDHHASRYHELVQREDADGDLRKAVFEIVNWRNTRVVEAGVGTGRVTSWYVKYITSALLLDRSEDMIDTARTHLSPFLHRLTFRICENTDLERMKRQVIHPDVDNTGADIFVEGWSFGHTVLDAEDQPGGIDERCDQLVHSSAALVRNGGTMIFLETLGTNVDEPGPPVPGLARFYERLETSYGFTRHEIRSDYVFDSVEQAADLCGFFFGTDMAESVRSRGSERVPEWTGMWTRRV